MSAAKVVPGKAEGWDIQGAASGAALPREEEGAPPGASGARDAPPDSDDSPAPTASSGWPWRCCCGSCASDKRRGLPPGPGGLPLLGASLRYKGPETNWEWTQQYGPIYSVRLGPSQLVYLNTLPLVELYMERQGAALLGRPEGPAAIAKGLLFGQGERWVENRQAFTRAMWQASFMQHYESIIQQEVEHVLEQLTQKAGRPLELRQVVLPAVTHRLVTVLLGQPLARDGEEMVTLVQQMTLLAEDVDLTSSALRLYLKVKRFRRVLQCLGGRPIPDMFHISRTEQALIKGWITRRRAALTQSGGQPDPNALLDQLLTSPEYVSRGQEFDDELVQSIMDLFNGGVSTTVSVLDFAILYLLHHPQVQDNMRAEIAQVVANGHHISWTNRSYFPYTYATLIETLRLASVTPSSLPHVATEDVVMEGYVVPKDVVVVASIFSLHRDPNFYDGADMFRPERHLGDDGQLVEPKSFRPFGVGERQCLGYRMAQMELFVFLARLVSTFSFQAEDPSHPPPFHTKMRVVRRLEPFACVVERRDTTTP